MCARFALILFFSGQLYWFACSPNAETPAIGPQWAHIPSGGLKRRGHLLDLIQERIDLIFQSGQSLSGLVKIA